MKNIIIAAILLSSSTKLYPQAVYEDGILLLDRGIYKNTYFENVGVTISGVDVIGGGNPEASIAGYYDQTNQIHLPEVIYKDESYFNIIATLSGVVSTGLVQDIFDSPAFVYTTDISEINYPESYTKAGQPEYKFKEACDLNITNTLIPKLWLNEERLPTVNGAPFSSNIKAGIGIKDIMLPKNPAFILSGNPNYPLGCDNSISLKSEMLKTITRLKNLNVEYVYLPQWHWIEVLKDDSWRIMEADRAFGPVTNDDLEFWITNAKANGMKTIMFHQIQGWIDSPEEAAYSIPYSEDNYEKWLRTYKEFVVSQINYFDRIGVDIISASCSGCVYGSATADVRELTVWKEIIDEVRAKSSMQISVDFFGDTFESMPEIVNSIDYLVPNFWINSDGLDGKLLSKNEIKELIRFDSVNKALEYSKTIIFGIAGYQSRDNLFRNPGYVEETVCTSKMNTFITSSSFCIQNQTMPDFSLQAVIHAAFYERINDLMRSNTDKEAIVMPLDYYITDNLLPYTAFPSIGDSIRNKPAEGIFKEFTL